MATFYISTTGSNGNTGAISQPWATIEYALAHISGGDTIYYRAGTYDEFIHASYVIPSGSAGAPTVIAGYPGETVTWQPTFGNTRVVTLGESATTSYVTFRNLIFDGINTNGPFSDGFLIYRTAHHIIVEDFVLMNAWHEGFHPDGADCIFRRGVVHDVGRGPIGGQPSAHGVYCTNANNLFEDLEFYNCPGYGIQIQYENANFNTVNRCTIHHCGGGLVLSTATNPGLTAGHNNTVHNSIFYSNGSGIACAFGGPGIGRNHLVYNNTIYGNTGIGIFVSGGEDCIIRNNIIYNNGENIRNNGTNITFSNNLQTNPLFTDAAGADFSLTPFSDAINAGTVSITSGVTLTDFYGSAPDIGALEFGDTPPPNSYNQGVALEAVGALAFTAVVAIHQSFSLVANTLLDVHTNFNGGAVFEDSSTSLAAKGALTFGTPKKALHVTFNV